MDWQSFMERTTPTMQYQAWRHDPEVDSEVQFSISCRFCLQLHEKSCVSYVSGEFRYPFYRSHFCLLVEARFISLS